MGTLLLLLTVLAELFLMTLCLTTKSHQAKWKGAIRIGALTGFALLALLKVVDWSSRYYALAALLVLLASLTTIEMVRKRKETRSIRPKRVVLGAVGMTVLWFLATLPAILFPQYSPLAVTGRYQVAAKTLTYADPNRVETYTNTGDHRKLAVGFWYPENPDGKYPLVVFSHGGISTITSNESLYRELASHGYVVASISHTYHAITTTVDDGRTLWIDQGYMRDLQAENAKTNRQQSYELYQQWMKIRTDDINFVIDSIISAAGTDGPNPIAKLVDTAAIGVMGHSLGGSAALGVGRIRDDVGAVIALESPFMYDIKGVENGEFVFTREAYPVPLLNVYSDHAWNHLAEWPQYAQNQAYLSRPTATAFNVHIRGVGHFSLTDLALSSPMFTRMLNGFPATTSTEEALRTVNKVCLAFFDAYLKKSGEF